MGLAGCEQPWVPWRGNLGHPPGERENAGEETAAGDGWRDGSGFRQMRVPEHRPVRCGEAQVDVEPWKET